MTQQTTRATAGRRPGRRGGWFWSRLHFLLRFAGLVGFVALLVGLVLVRPLDQFYESWRGAYQTLADAARGAAPADAWQRAGVYCILGGAAAVLLALLVESALVLSFVAGRRSLMGFNAVVQVGLAAALLVGVNVYSFTHRPLRLDCTRAKEFTLPADVEGELKKLTAPTTIVVYKLHKSPKDKVDKRYVYDAAAEREIVEQVNDLVQQFRQVGPQFSVVTLDAEDRKFGEKLKAVTEEEGHPRPRLREAIDAAQENSIFFYQDTRFERPDGTAEYRDGRVQQLSFDEFYQLDKPASKAGRGNLVLLPQGGGTSGRGVETFANKIVHVEQRKPRVGILVVHELLTSEGSQDSYTLRGLRKVLTSHGFEVRDVVLKKNWGRRRRPPDPAADTLDESKLERVESEIGLLEADLKTIEAEIKDYQALVADWTLKPDEDEDRKLDGLSRKYARELRGGRVTPAGRRRLLEFFQTNLGRRQEDLDETKRDLAEKKKERDRLDTEGVAEGRRLSDVPAKLANALSDCDLLLIPRVTRNPDPSFDVSNRAHKLSPKQLAEIKQFLRSGRPVFACLGPINEPPDEADPRAAGPARDDNFEALLAELGIRLPAQTVLFKVDAKEFADRRPNVFTSTTEDKVPPVDFDSPTHAAAGRWFAPGAGALERPNPLRESLRVTAHSVGAGFDLRIRFPRPVYYDPVKPWVPAAEAAGDFGLLALPMSAGPLAVTARPPRRARTDAAFQATGYFDAAQPWAPPAQVASTAGVLTCATAGGPLPALAALPRTRTDPTFLLSGAGWNDSEPYPVPGGRRPRYEPPKPDDPANGTPEEKRRGAFPIGVAVETPVPPGWAPDSPALVRVAVIGQGDVFTGPELSPAQERLLLQTTNWLLRRDELLPSAEHQWRYPRVELTEPAQSLWLWGCRGGMPLACAFLGFVVLLARRVR
jgi:hypothetical protein